MAVLRNLGRAHLALGDTSRAIELFREMIRRGGRYHFVGGCAEANMFVPLSSTAGYRLLLKEIEEQNDSLRALY